MTGKRKLMPRNLLYVKKMTIYPDYISKHNLNNENQIILLMILIEKQWHYLTVKIFSALLTGMTSKHVGDFFFELSLFV